MLEDKDIEKLVAVLATKKDLEDMSANAVKIFSTKEDVKEIRQDISDLRELIQGLLIATDKMATNIGIMTAEYGAITTQLTRHEKWIKEISEKVGVHLSYE